MQISKGLVIGIVAAFLAVDAASADLATVTTATFPTARYGTSAVWDGTNAYIFGGIDGGILRQIARYDPTTDIVATMTSKLPTARSGTSAVWDGASAYVFGGHDTGFLNQIVRYNPATDTVTTMAATLPGAMVDSSAVWDGTNAYIFGGNDGTPGAGILDKIVRYNPATDTVTTMTATLPSARFYTSAVWDGTNAYIFGGRDGSGANLDEIVRYDPATGSVTTMAAALPTGRLRASAVWDGTSAYIFGGHDNGFLSEIVRYDPGADTVTTMGAMLPSPRIATSAVWDGTNAYVFGGHDDGFLNQIVRYTPDRNAPPVCTEAGSTVDSLWPPHHQFVPVSVDGVTDSDGDRVTVRVTSVYQDEPVNAIGSGLTGPDAQDLSGGSVEVRAERAGGGNGRVYHLGFEASDGRGGFCTGVAQVEVPLSARRHAADDGPVYDSTVA